MPGRRSKAVKVDGSSDGSGCARWGCSALLLLFTGWFIFWLPRSNTQTVQLVFPSRAPYCAECLRGMRRSQAVVLSLGAVGMLSLCLTPFVAALAPDGMSGIWLLPLLLALACLVALLLVRSGVNRSQAVHILDFQVAEGTTCVDLQFENPQYAALFQLENSILALANDPRPPMRQKAAQQLAALEDRRATFPLIAACGDPSDEVRQAAVGALVRMNDPAAQEPLIAKLQDQGRDAPGCGQRSETAQHRCCHRRGPHWRAGGRQLSPGTPGCRRSVGSRRRRRGAPAGG